MQFCWRRSVKSTYMVAQVEKMNTSGIENGGEMFSCSANVALGGNLLAKNKLRGIFLL